MQAFQVAMENRDGDAAVGLLSPTVVFRSPVVFRPYEGVAAVEPILRSVVRVVEDLTYRAILGDEGPGRTQALVFRARVAGRDLEGCDFVRLDHRGLIDELVVMVRPMTAAIALAEAMRDILGAQ